MIQAVNINYYKFVNHPPHPPHYMFPFLLSKRAKHEDLRQEALPFLMFMLGLIGGVLCSEFMILVRENFIESNPSLYGMYFWFIMGLTPLTVGYIFWNVYKNYLRPMGKLEKAIKKKRGDKKIIWTHLDK